MLVKYSTEGGRTEAHLAGRADWKLFDRVADLIGKEFNCRPVEKLDGLDQRYWDLAFGDVKLTLHLEHYSGISLFAAKDNENISAANQLVQKIGAYLEANAAS